MSVDICQRCHRSSPSCVTFVSRPWSLGGRHPWLDRLDALSHLDGLVSRWPVDRSAAPSVITDADGPAVLTLIPRCRPTYAGDHPVVWGPASTSQAEVGCLSGAQPERCDPRVHDASDGTHRRGVDWVRAQSLARAVRPRHGAPHRARTPAPEEACTAPELSWSHFRRR